MSEVVDFPGETTLDIPPDKILKAAQKANLKYVLVLGWHEDGTIYAAGSTASVAEGILITEQFKHAILSGDA